MRPLHRVVGAAKTGADDFRFKVATTLVAAAYGVYFFAPMLWAFNVWETDALDITWNIGENPRTFIALALIFGALFLWVWRGIAGKAVAFAAFGFVLWQFYEWYGATQSVKENIGAQSLPQAGRVGNVWLGAGWLEPLTLIAVLLLLGYLLCVNARHIVLSVKKHFAKNAGGGQDAYDFKIPSRARNG